jgi:hypothetical protein
MAHPRPFGRWKPLPQGDIIVNLGLSIIHVNYTGTLLMYRSKASGLRKRKMAKQAKKPPR